MQISKSFGMGNLLGTRIIGLDLLRSCAILFVIAGHFFSLHTSFVTETFEGASMFVQATAIHLFYTGVPLFIMMTGFLNRNKTISKGYYRSCIRVLTSYLIFSIVTILFRKYYLHEAFSWGQWGHKILDFTAIPYAWYIEMWIGLFLLTPFLNMMYKAIPSRQQKLLLLATFYIMTAFPDLLNRYGFHLVPGFWKQMFPLMFYFAGSYINEYQPQVKKRKLMIGILLFCMFTPLLNTFFISNHTYVLFMGGSQGVLGAWIAVFFFLLCYQWDTQQKFARKALTKISLLSLDMYLCCYIFDAWIYPFFKEHYFINQSQFGWWFFVIVPILFLGSFAMAWIKDKIMNIHGYLRNSSH